MNLPSTLFLVALAATANGQCPPTFFEADGGCFYVLDTGETDISWLEARVRCSALAPGWAVDLASIDSTAQLEAFAEKWATSISANYRPYAYMWVGFTRESGEWTNLDGVPISLYSNMWRESHPHNMNMYTYIEDVTMTSGVKSRGRFYASCTMSTALQRALCRAYPHK